MYENRINIFDLHDPREDTRPAGWICIGRDKIRKIVDDILREIIMSETPMIYVILDSGFKKNLISRCSKICGSQRELGKKLNVSQQEISKWYLGIRCMPIIAVKSMIKMLKIPDEEIRRNLKQEKFDYKQTISKFSLSKILANRLGCSKDVVWRSLSGKDYIPIPVILELLNMWKEKTKKGGSDIKRILNEINHLTEFLKLNNPASKPVKAVKNLNTDLCKILGAFAADGNLYLQVKLSSFDKEKIKKIRDDIFGDTSNEGNILFDRSRNCYFFWTSYQEPIDNIKGRKFPKNIWISFNYKMTLREQYEDSVKIFSNWFENTFGVKLDIKKSKGENEWFVVITNKIIGRYLKNIFGFPAGKKSETVDEPLIIKKSNYKYRKAFALGVMTFDGSVSLEPRLRLMVKSEKLRDSIADILSKEFGRDNLIVGLTKRGEYYLQTKKNLPIKNMMNFVEEGTVKYKRLKTFLNLHKISLDEMGDIFHSFEGENIKLRFMEVFNILQKEKEADLYSLQRVVKRELNINISILTLNRILDTLSKTPFVCMEKKKIFHKKTNYKNIYKFNEVYNENR